MSLKPLYALLAGLVVATGLTFCSARVFRNRIYYNSARDVLFNVTAFFEDRTKYAPSYSEVKFRNIQKGMSEENVRSLLGEPLSKDTHQNDGYREIWRYTDGPPDSNYWSRAVVFDEKGIVQNVEREYFVD